MHVFGQVNAYAPSSCSPAPVKQNQLRVFQNCPITTNGTATVPAPAPLDTTTADTIAAGTDATTINKWAGALVEMTNVSAQAVDGGGAVGAFGVIKLNETKLEAHDKIMYYDAKDPKNPSNAWVYATAPTFNRIDGLIYLDFCTWSLNPRDKCTDLDPKSDDCP